MSRPLWAALAIVAGAALAAPAPFLRVGETLLALPPGGGFTYEYRHSVYEVPVREELRVAAGRLVLDRVSTADRRALEYLRWPGEPVARGAGFSLDTPGISLERLELRVAREGEQVIRSGGQQVRLLAIDGEGAVVVVQGASASVARWLVAQIAR